MSSRNSTPETLKKIKNNSKNSEIENLKQNLLSNKNNYQTAKKNIILDSKLNIFSPKKTKINKYDLTTKPLIYFSTNITSKEGTKNLSYSIQSSENIFFGESKPSLTSLESKNEMANYNNVLKNNGVDPNKIEEKNLLVPISKKNDEKFKLLKIQKLKKKFPPFQSAKRFEEEEKKNFKKYLEEEEKYSILKKKKIIYSTKKELFVFVSLFNDKGEEKKFPLFKDSDIGISHYWQAKIVDSQIDEDYETDEEQKNVARYYCIKELKEAFQVLFNKGNKIVQNTKFLD